MMAGGMIKEWQIQSSGGGRWETAAGISDSRFYIETGGKLQALGAQTLYFEHEKSGASLFYIRNKDTNRDSRFPIGHRIWMRRTRIMCLSIRYLLPLINIRVRIFFDLCSKTYHTFVNAFTYIPFTAYPVCSQSEEQLLKMADVYLSCMKAPGIRRERRFFDREAVRYELRDRKSRLRWQERCTARISAC